MKNNKMTIDENDMNNASQNMNRAFLETSDLNSGLKGNFSSITNTGLFGTGLNKLSKQIDSVSNSIHNVQNTIRLQTEKITSSEREFVRRAEELEIPQDFVKNDSRKVNSLSDIKLNKDDGKQIKTSSVSSSDEIDDYDLKSIKIGNINNDNEQPQRYLKDFTFGNETNLKDITSDYEQSQSEIGDDTLVSSSSLEDISNSETQENEFDDNYSEHLKNLDSINSQNYNDEKVLDESSYNGISMENIESVLKENMNSVLNNIGETQKELNNLSHQDSDDKDDEKEDLLKYFSINENNSDKDKDDIEIS